MWNTYLHKIAQNDQIDNQFSIAWFFQYLERQWKMCFEHYGDC